ncbi:MAG: LLM class flavin-dependent oxidoreductase [Myxococcota bacterium]|nr:LLM class flavin-dependent oxidoreductase [Spirochaeta sp.]RPG08018.1 MAG: LLM class flavin-dependent oxidoreductase [Proteobacteria bacterium TMED72]
MENDRSIQVGVLADAEMLTGPHDRRRTRLEHVAQVGLDYVFVADHISFYTGFGMDGLIQAATAAALEPTLGVHLGVYLLALRHPVPVARQIASLCESAPGRLVLGVGVGGEDRHEIEICGVDPSTRGRRTNECLEVLRGLLSGESTDFSGEFFQLEKALIKPCPDPPVPILIGGRSDAAIRRTARLGDGWLGVWCSPRRYKDVLAQVAEEASEAGRNDVAWRHGLQIWVGVDETREAARKHLAARMESMYQIPFERFEKYSPYGDPTEVADFLAQYVEAGAGHFNIMIVGQSSEAAIDAGAEIKAQLLKA